MRTLITALLLGLGVSAQPAAAAVYNVSFSGTINHLGGIFTPDNGADTYGYFGTAGADLTGQRFVATFMVDDSNAVTSGDATTQGISGPGVTGSLSIGGSAAYTFASDITGSTQRTNHFSGDYVPNNFYAVDDIEGYVNGANGSLLGQILSYDTDFLSTADLSSSLDYAAKPEDYNYPNKNHGGGSAQVGAAGQQELFYFLTDHVTVAAAPAAVPEPASWAMMLTGFGLVGGAMRGTRRTKAIQA